MTASRTIVCVVDGCDAWVIARDLCSRHHARWQAQGKPDDVSSLSVIGRPDLATSGHAGKRRDVVGYNGALGRVRTERGPARLYVCVECHLADANRWSYVAGTDPDERLDEFGRRYSLNVDVYEPRCASCALRLRHRQQALAS